MASSLCPAGCPGRTGRRRLPTRARHSRGQGVAQAVLPACVRPSWPAAVPGPASVPATDAAAQLVRAGATGSPGRSGLSAGRGGRGRAGADQVWQHNRARQPGCQGVEPGRGRPPPPGPAPPSRGPALARQGEARHRHLPGRAAVRVPSAWWLPPSPEPRERSESCISGTCAWGRCQRQTEQLRSLRQVGLKQMLCSQVLPRHT